MKLFTLLAFTAFFSLISKPALAGTTYSTSCVIEDGEAKGFVHTDGSLSFSGKVYIYQYDESHREVEKGWEIAIVIVVGQDSEFVADTDADDDAVSCYLDITEAVD